MTLDLTQPITREQYVSAVTGLMTFLRGEAADRGWCSERHRYFAALIPEYTRYDECGADFTQVPPDADYAERLSLIRGRFLWYARHDTISLDQARRGLEAAGLEGIPAKGGRQYSTRLQEVQFSGTDAAMGERYSTQVQDLIRRAVDAYRPEPGSGDEWYVPGSFRFVDVRETWINRLEENAKDLIPVSQVIRPGYV